MGKNIYFKFTFLVFLSLISLVFVNSSDASEPIEFILAWDANAEENLDGYEIYFSNSYSDFVLLGDVYVEELADPDNPMVTITDVYNGVPSDLIIPSVKLPTSEKVLKQILGKLFNESGAKESGLLTQDMADTSNWHNGYPCLRKVDGKRGYYTFIGFP